AEPDRGAAARADAWPEGPHLRLHALRFGDLALAETDPQHADPESASRAAQLWLGLAQAAIAGEGASPAEGPAASDAGQVARAIDGRAGTEAYDQVVVGYLLQLAEELKAEGAHAASIRV